MRNRMAASDRSVTERERKNIAISTRIAQEGIVLLENKGVLPLHKDVKTIALFGSGARRTVKGGTGSGDVNTRGYVTVEKCRLSDRNRCVAFRAGNYHAPCEEGI